MHGAGNDYIYVDCFDQPVPTESSRLAISMSDRHTGIGGDGLILIRPSDVADARMQMFNADGSEAEMCGNGVRCIGKYIYEKGIAPRDVVNIETVKEVVELRLEIEQGIVQRVRVNMGAPILEAAKIPTTLPGDPPVLCELSLENGNTQTVTCVSMGNPHCVTFLPAIRDEHVLGLGPEIERHSAFPNRVNAEFVRIDSPNELTMRVWERGTGETLACGSGACAAVVAGVLAGLTENKVGCHLPGGTLEVDWAENRDVFLTGPATEVFTGHWPIG